MDSINSFKGYGKVSEAEDRAFRKKSRKRLIVIGVSVVVLVAIIVGGVIGVFVHKKDNNSTQNPSPSSPAESIKAVCSLTQHPDSCFSSIASIDAANTTDPEELIKLSLQVAINEVEKILTLPDSIKAKVNDPKIQAALTDCRDLFDASIDQLNASLSSMKVSKGEKLLTKSKVEDLKTWLSAAITDQETCLDGLDEISVDVKNELRVAMRNATELSSNSLGIVAGIFEILERLDIPIHRKLLGFDQFPDWLSGSDRRKLLQASTRPDAVVAKDGSGNFTSIQKAVDAVPKKSLNRYVIQVKSGLYVEQVTVDKSKWNVMIVGEGQSETIISGSKNFVDGTPTFSTATFIAVGRGFIAKDIGFENTAGPEKHQAVALRSGSDRSVFYRCSFNGYQDTLYAHSLRQFYRECEISGTIDFIFGNAASVFQNCNIRPRQPMTNQQNTITAQGKTDPEQNTGISIHGCQISPFDKNLTARTYLGRPWKPYSTTVIIKSVIGGLVDPAGWLAWTTGVLPPKTIFYAEYQNTGPGSSMAKRVDWPGYRPGISEEEAGKYVVDSFIQGSEWLPETGVLFSSNL